MASNRGRFNSNRSGAIRDNLWFYACLPSTKAYRFWYPAIFRWHVCLVYRVLPA